jgi:hypothetical protein
MRVERRPQDEHISGDADEANMCGMNMPDRASLLHPSISPRFGAPEGGWQTDGSSFLRLLCHCHHLSSVDGGAFTPAGDSAPLFSKIAVLLARTCAFSIWAKERLYSAERLGG